MRISTRSFARQPRPDLLFMATGIVCSSRAVARGLFIRAETASSGSRIMTAISSHVTMLNQQVGV